MEILLVLLYGAIGGLIASLIVVPFVYGKDIWQLFIKPTLKKRKEGIGK